MIKEPQSKNTETLGPQLPIPVGKAKGSQLDVTFDAVSQTQAQELATQIAQMDPWAKYPYPADGIASYLEKQIPREPRYAIHCGDDLVGACGFQLNWLRGPYVQFLAILPKFQGNGFGGVILDWVCREARLKECRNVWVLASDFNSRARDFYKDNGFAEVCEIPDLVRDGRTEILMRKMIL